MSGKTNFKAKAGAAYGKVKAGTSTFFTGGTKPNRAAQFLIAGIALAVMVGMCFANIFSYTVKMPVIDAAFDTKGFSVDAKMSLFDIAEAAFITEDIYGFGDEDGGYGDDYEGDAEGIMEIIEDIILYLRNLGVDVSEITDSQIAFIKNVAEDAMSTGNFLKMTIVENDVVNSVFGLRIYAILFFVVLAAALAASLAMLITAVIMFITGRSKVPLVMLGLPLGLFSTLALLTTSALAADGTAALANSVYSYGVTIGGGVKAALIVGAIAIFLIAALNFKRADKSEVKPALMNFLSMTFSIIGLGLLFGANIFKYSEAGTHLANYSLLYPFVEVGQGKEFNLTAIFSFVFALGAAAYGTFLIVRMLCKNLAGKKYLNIHNYILLTCALVAIFTARAALVTITGANEIVAVEVGFGLQAIGAIIMFAAGIFVDVISYFVPKKSSAAPASAPVQGGGNTEPAPQQASEGGEAASAPVAAQ